MTVELNYYEYNLLDLLCHQASWGLCMPPVLLVWLPTHQRIPGWQKSKIMFSIYRIISSKKYERIAINAAPDTIAVKCNCWLWKQLSSSFFQTFLYTPFLWSCPGVPQSISRTWYMSSLCTRLCETASQYQSTPQKLCWLTTATPTTRKKNTSYGFHGQFCILCHSVIALGAKKNWFITVSVYLASPGLDIPHVSSVGLETDHSSKVHIFIEEL